MCVRASLRASSFVRPHAGLGVDQVLVFSLAFGASAVHGQTERRAAKTRLNRTKHTQNKQTYIHTQTQTHRHANERTNERPTLFGDRLRWVLQRLSWLSWWVLWWSRKRLLPLQTSREIHQRNFRGTAEIGGFVISRLDNGEMRFAVPFQSLSACACLASFIAIHRSLPTVDQDLRISSPMAPSSIRSDPRLSCPAEVILFKVTLLYPVICCAMLIPYDHHYRLGEHRYLPSLIHALFPPPPPKKLWTRNSRVSWSLVLCCLERAHFPQRFGTVSLVRSTPVRTQW